MNANLVDKSLLNFIESHISPIPECGCWLWDEDESNQIHYDKFSAHVDVFMYLIYRGPVTENQKVVHTCQIACCVNPEHLSLCTKTDEIEKDKLHSLSLNKRH
jgi:predicted transglutaminase-like protease